MAKMRFHLLASNSSYGAAAGVIALMFLSACANSDLERTASGESGDQAKQVNKTTATAQANDVFDGSRLYAEHCMRCHGNDGVPLLPGTPDLSRGEGLQAPDEILLRSLRFGKRLMPGFESVLRDRELLSVLVYVRSLRR